MITLSLALSQREREQARAWSTLVIRTNNPEDSQPLSVDGEGHRSLKSERRAAAGERS